MADVNETWSEVSDTGALHVPSLFKWPQVDLWHFTGKDKFAPLGLYIEKSLNRRRNHENMREPLVEATYVTKNAAKPTEGKSF